MITLISGSRRVLGVPNGAQAACTCCATRSPSTSFCVSGWRNHTSENCVSELELGSVGCGLIVLELAGLFKQSTELTRAVDIGCLVPKSLDCRDLTTSTHATPTRLRHSVWTNSGTRCVVVVPADARRGAVSF